jgi:hypothetical protein
MLHTPIFRLIYVRAFVSGLCAAGGSRREAARLLRTIRRYRFPLARAFQLNLRALLELARGRLERGIALLGDGARLYDDAGFVLHAAACRYRAAELAGDIDALASARSQLGGLGIVDPERWVAMTVPRVSTPHRRFLRAAPTSAAADRGD